MTIQYNPTEEEAIILKAVWDQIQGAVNYAFFCKFPNPSDVTLMPKTGTDLRLFNILVGDFLAAPKHGTLGLKGVPHEAVGSERTYLAYLRRIVADPQFRPGAEALIGEPVERFAAWLDASFTVEKVWLSNVSIEIDLTLTRLDAIKICGNIAKHNFSRLEADVGRIRKIMEANDRAVSEEEAYLLLPDFYEWFHTNIFAYHTSHIGEMLNGIIWGIYDYLLPEFARAYRKTSDDPNDVMYGYDVPPAIGENLARAMYWDLMNDVRRRPYVERFKAHWSLKERY